jgi:pimeloyl-ACP methyl ester carboxylesterase
VHYRQPGEFQECVLDVLGALSFLKRMVAARWCWSPQLRWGGGDQAPGSLPPVAGVAALSSQRFGTSTVENLAPRPLLPCGTHDVVLPHEASEDIYERARQPKRLTLLEGAGHGLMEAHDELIEMLEMFIVAMAGNFDPVAAQRGITDASGAR